MLLGMTHPTTGTGSVLGKRIGDPRESRDMRRRVAYVAEDKQLYAYLTVAEMIRFTRSFYSDWQSDAEHRLLKQFQLPPDKKVRSLSKGMRTKLALLLGMARRPELLILDEPSEGLDPVSIEEMLQSLVVASSEGTTVFFSSHQIADVERIADRVCVINRGRVVADLALDRMRQDYRRVTVGFDSDAKLPLLPVLGIQNMRIDGRQATFIANQNSQDIAALANGLGAVSVDVQPVSLRELFLEYAKDPQG
jgi:ABC-2 type transport system ATP-binding protein